MIRAAMGMLLALLALNGAAAEVKQPLDPLPLDPVVVDLADSAGLRDGAQTFGDYCAGCHSLKYQRYQRVADDLGIAPEVITRHFSASSSTRLSEQMIASLPAADARKAFGALPPDLTLIARVRGNDWLYTYLRSFYADPARPWGVNNRLVPDVGMPNVLAALQGRRVLDCGAATGAGCVLSPPIAGTGSLDPARFDAKVKNLVAFLAYSSNPVKLQSQRIGTYVLLYLAFFLVFAWLLKRDYWKDVYRKL